MWNNKIHFSLSLSWYRAGDPCHRKRLLRHDIIQRWLPVEKERWKHSSGLTANQHRDERHLPSNKSQREETGPDSILTPQLNFVHSRVVFPRRPDMSAGRALTSSNRGLLCARQVSAYAFPLCSCKASTKRPSLYRSSSLTLQTSSCCWKTVYPELIHTKTRSRRNLRQRIFGAGP